MTKLSRQKCEVIMRICLSLCGLYSVLNEPQLYAVVLVLYSLRAGSGLFSAAGAATRRPHATTA